LPEVATTLLLVKPYTRPSVSGINGGKEAISKDEIDDPISRPRTEFDSFFSLDDIVVPVTAEDELEEEEAFGE
jgi:hypothetical protein